MILALDFGASTVDVVKWEKGNPADIQTFESNEYKISSLKDFFKDMKIDLSEISRICVTGGKSREFSETVFGVPVKKVNEIEAIGKGGRFLYEREIERRHSSLYSSVLVVSIGTGTCMVHVNANHGVECRHVGGTGIGGGTFLGLAREILGETDVSALIDRFKRGNVWNVDLSVGDIVGEGIGIVPADMTASNLGKLAREVRFSRDDLAAGIVNLVGQTIATASVFAAQAQKADVIVLTGKLTRIEQIVEIIYTVGRLYGVEIVLPENAEYVSAIGAGVHVLSSSTDLSSAK